MIGMRKPYISTPRWIPLAIAGIGMIGANRESKKAARYEQLRAAEERKAIEAGRREANIEAQRARVAQIRESRIARARIVAESARGGMGVSTTGLAGATASIQSQTAANIGAINVAQSFSDIASAANIQAANFAGAGAAAQAKSAQWQTLSNLGFTAFNQVAGGFAGLFSKPVKGAQATTTASSEQLLAPKQYTFGS